MQDLIGQHDPVVGTHVHADAGLLLEAATIACVSCGCWPLYTVRLLEPPLLPHAASSDAATTAVAMVASPRRFECLPDLRSMN